MMQLESGPSSMYTLLASEVLEFPWNLNGVWLQSYAKGIHIVYAPDQLSAIFR